MKNRDLICLTLCLLLTGLPLAASKAEGTPATFEGGSLEIPAHKKVEVHVGKQFVRVSRDGEHTDIPIGSITEVSYGQEVHRRVGSAIGLGLLSLGLGAFLLFSKKKTDYIGIVWAAKPTDPKPDDKGGLVLRVGKNDYMGLIKSLEGMTGLKAVNTDALGSNTTKSKE